MLCTYSQLLDELQPLPSIQQYPIPISSTLGRQALGEKLWIRSMVFMLGNLSKPSGSSKLNIAKMDANGGGAAIQAQDSSVLSNNN
jgi:hypothetical protein